MCSQIEQINLENHFNLWQKKPETKKTLNLKQKHYVT